MLSFSNFKLKYPNSVLTQADVELKFELYKGELSPYFRFEELNQYSEFTDIKFCGQGIVYLKKPLILNNLYPILVEEINKKTRMLINLVENVDFLFLTKTLLNQKYIYGLDFECMNCICKCDQLKLTGNWGILLPTSLEDAIYNLIDKKLVTDEGDCADVQSEAIGEYRVTYKEKKEDKNSLNINTVYSIPNIAGVVNLIQPNFLNV